MLSPVSPSATGKTLRSLTSSRRDFKLRESRLDDEAEAEETRIGHGVTEPPRYALVTLPALRQRVQT